MFVQFHYNVEGKDIAHITSCYHLLGKILAKIPINISTKLKKHFSSNKSVLEACTLLLSLEKLFELELTTNTNIKIELFT